MELHPVVQLGLQLNIIFYHASSDATFLIEGSNN